MALDSLYLQTILDHYKAPRNRGPLDPFDGRAHLDNPTCGDEVTLWVRIDGNRIVRIGYEARGCAICTASASMMSESLQGRSLEEAGRFRETFLRMMERPPGAGEEQPDLGDLVALQGVRQYPARIQCARLAWDAFRKAIEDAKNG